MKPKQAYKDRSKGVPVRNVDTGRTVYVLPETLQKHPDRFKRVRDDEAGDPRWRGKPKPPKRPRKPDKPKVPRESPPAPIKRQEKFKLVKPTKFVTEVPEVDPPKVPVPSPRRRWKKLKKFLPTKTAVAVAMRYLQREASRRRVLDRTPARRDPNR